MTYPLKNRVAAICGTLAIVTLAIGAYLPAMQGDFLWDDEVAVVMNPWVRSPQGLRDFWLSTDPPDFFPLTNSLFWLQWRLWGTNTTGYHAVNVALHAAAALLLWKILRRLRIPGAWIAALAWAVHPINVPSVAWITELKNTLSMLFYLLATLAFLHWDLETRRWPWYAGALALFLLALLSKTSVVMLPVVLLLYLWWRHAGRNTEAPKRGDDMQYLETRTGLSAVAGQASHIIKLSLTVLPFLLLGLILAVITIIRQGRVIGSTELPELQWFERLLIAGRALWFYAMKIVAPIKLTAVYPRWHVDAGDPAWYLPWAGAALVVAICWRTRRGWGRHALFGLGIFAVSLFPVIGFFDMFYMTYSFVADQWAYVASAAMLPMLCAAGVAFTRPSRHRGTPEKKVNQTPRLPVLRHWRTVFMGVAFTLWLTFLWGASFTRAQAYTTAEALWTRNISLNPASWCAYNNLGQLRVAADDYDGALRYFHKAVRYNPKHVKALHNIGSILFEKGEYGEAAGFLQRALALEPDYVMAAVNYGKTLLKLNRPQAALLYLRKGLDSHTYAPQLYNRAALFLMHENTAPDLAIAFFRKTIQQAPESAYAHFTLGRALARQGNHKTAVNALRTSLELSPGRVMTLNELAWLLATSPDDMVRNGSEAVRFAQEACRITRRENPNLLDTLAAAYAETGRFNYAVETAREAMQLAIEKEQDKLADLLREHLTKFEAHQAIRDPAPQTVPVDNGGRR